ncbi:hypothetical protein EVAR_83946_1 [Eumeta japonica]|uniref:Uncharacterized protein n=1 Tax=Eumeta variegata TaxID=151549 RepID=A0A4C1VMD2_EUMVA|nr:hypothetical protein EVAR_83946_1 [Eumeta japonica]
MSTIVSSPQFGLAQRGELLMSKRVNLKRKGSGGNAALVGPLKPHTTRFGELNVTGADSMCRLDFHHPAIRINNILTANPQKQYVLYNPITRLSRLHNDLTAVADAGADIDVFEYRPTAFKRRNDVLFRQLVDTGQGGMCGRRYTDLFVDRSKVYRSRADE